MKTDENHPLYDALVELQSRLAFQDQTINELNAVITSQQNQIDRLELRLKSLHDKMEMLEESVDIRPQNDVNEKPPHY